MISPDLETELLDVYKPFEYIAVNPASKQKQKRFIDAISEGLRQSMELHPDLVIMGQDIAEYGGVFKITENFVELVWKSTGSKYAYLRICDC